MKQLVLLFVGFLLVGLVSYGQTNVANVAEYRIATATTVFGVNIPVGTKIYNMATQEYWVAIAGSASTLTLTTGAANFVKLNGKEMVDETVSASWNGKTTEAGSKDDIHDYIIIGDTDLDGKANVLDLGTAGLVKTDASGVVSTAIANTDYDASITNEAQTLSAGGTTAPTISLNQVGGAGGGTITLNGGNGTTLNQAAGTITISESNTNEGVIGVGAGGANTALITSNSSGANGVTFNGLGNVQITETTSTNGGTINIGMLGGNTKTESFEEASGTPTAHALTSTPVLANGARVSLNGATLKPTQYTITTTTLTLAVPVVQYDQVTVTYTY